MMNLEILTGFFVSALIVSIVVFIYFKNFLLVTNVARCGSVRELDRGKIRKLVKKPAETKINEDSLFLARGDSATSNFIYHNDIVLIEKNDKYNANDMVVINYNNSYKIRKLVSKKDLQWITSCDNKGEKTHDESLFVGKVVRVYRKNSWKNFEKVAA